MNTKKKNARGITLIALVITIIVLLILAGVTINALSGENGIITKSKEAKIKTEKSKTIEKINLAILTAMTKGDGDIDNATLREELEKEGLTVKTEGNNLPWDVSDGKYIYRINEDYTVEEVEGINLSKKEIKLASGENETITATLTEGVTGTITWESADKNVATVENGKITAVGTTGSTTITAKVEGTEYEATCKVSIVQKVTSITAEQIAANPEKYYGQVAQNYTQGDLTYRIFYVDKENKFGDGANTIYLKADYKKTTTLSSYISYTPTGSDLEKYKKMNPSWAAQRGSSTSSWNYNEHAAAWLCSPSQWTTYVDSSKANYAIGGPSVEMYVKSYNQVSHNQEGNYTLGATYRDTSAPGYIYTLNGAQSTISNSDYSTGTDSLDYKGYNSMYAGQNGSKSGWWWLASPSSYTSNYVCIVDGSLATLDTSNYYYNAGGAGPLVSLKSGIQVEIEE